MLTSDFGNYSEADSILTNSLTSDSIESSDFQGSELDAPETNSSYERKVKSKSRSRVQKKVKYWTLPTMSSGTFNPSMLTARQQLQYLAQKSKLGEESDSLELSPLRLDRIKFEEMKSMTGPTSKEHETSNNSNANGNNNTSPVPQQSSPSNRNASSSKNVRGSKLKEEISSSPTKSKSKEAKRTRKQPNELKQKKVKFSEENVVPSEPVNLRGFAVTSSTKDVMTNDKETSVDNVISNITSDNTESNSSCVAVDVGNTGSPDITTDVVSNVPDTSFDTATLTPSEPNNISDSLPNSNSFVGNVKSFLFDYKSHHRKHFENFLKDFAKRLGLSPEDEIVQKKREEILRKGMI